MKESTSQCSYPECPKSALLEGLCEQHYLLQYVQPWQKERRNLEDALAIANANISENCQKLYKARHPNGDPNARLLRQRPDGAYTNTAMVFCHKCWKPFEGAIECGMHEEDYKGKKPITRKTGERHHDNSAGKARASKEILIDDSELLNDI